MSERYAESCAVCSTPNATVWHEVANDNFWIDCPACGEFVLDGFVRQLGGVGAFGDFWTPARRAALSHFIRTRREFPMKGAKKDRPYVARDDLARFEKEGISLPSRLAQADNVLRYLAQREIEDGEPPFETPEGLWALVGSSNSISMADLFIDLRDEGYLAHSTSKEPVDENNASVVQARLTLGGWRRWEHAAGSHEIKQWVHSNAVWRCPS